MDPDIGSDYERPWRLVQGLAKRGLRVVVVAREVNRIEELGPNVELERPPGSLPNSAMGRIIDRPNLYLHARRVAHREVRSGRAFVVHHLGPCGGGSPSLIGRLQVPFVYGPVPAPVPAYLGDEEWQSWVRTSDAQAAPGLLSKVLVSRASPLAHFLRSRTLQRADAITVEAQTEAFIGDQKAVVIRPGIDVDQFKPRDQGEAEAGRIVAVGRLLSRKGYDLLIRSVGRVVRSLPSTHLFLVGSGPQEETLRSLVTQLGLDASVTFTGNVSRADLIRLLQSAEVFCHPARWESYFPAAPLEAMATGLPMIVSTAGALPELVGDFAGRVHAAGDEEQLTRDLREVLSNRLVRRALGAAARAHIVKHFTWETMCDAYFELYQRLARSVDSTPIR
jgi:glycosyltransferase involved in cell wall biosynthesis